MHEFHWHKVLLVVLPKVLFAKKPLGLAVCIPSLNIPFLGPFVLVHNLIVLIRTLCTLVVYLECCIYYTSGGIVGYHILGSHLMTHFDILTL